MPTDGITVEKFFEQAKWNYTKLDENVWRTGVQGRVRDFTILVRLTEQWLFVQTGILYAPNPECTQQLYQHLLWLNYQMNLVKFALGSNGEIALMVEMPIEDLDFSEFETALLALATYADQSYLEVANLAMHPDGESPPPDEPPAELSAIASAQNGTVGGNYL